MKTRKGITLLILFLFFIITIMGEFNIVSAKEGNLVLNIKKERNLGYSYKLNDKTGKDIWKIYNTENDQYDTIYCLKGGPGFGSSDMSSGTAVATYTKYFDMRKPNEPDMPTEYRNKLPQGDNYNKLMWVLDHCYVLPKKDPSSEESARTQENKKILLDAVKQYIEDNGLEGTIIQDVSYLNLLTEDDIDVVQQLAIWYYTNSDVYHVEDFTLYLSENGKGMYSPLEEEIMSRSLFPNGPQRAEACKTLFDYLIKTSKEEGTNYDYSANTSVSQPATLANTNITMKLVGNRYILGPYKIEGASNIDYTLTGTVTAGGTTVQDVTYLNESQGSIGNKTLKDLVGTNFYISIPNTVDISQIKFEISGAYYQTEVNYWSVANPKNTDQPVVKIEKVRKTFSDSKVFTPGEFDLALRKFIISIAGQGVTDSREPVISQDEITKLASKTASWDKGTTAKKDHPKNPLPVKTGDLVVYKIRVYNEGPVAGYVTEVTDYLPDGLEFVQGSNINNTYEWTCSDGKTVKTNHLQNTKIDAFNGVTIDYEDLEIECKVVAKPGASLSTLTNIAEITAHKDEYGRTNVTDRDSTPKNVTIVGYGEQSQQDDDDFERLTLSQATGEYEIELEKVDSRNTNKKLQGATFDVSINGAGATSHTTDSNGKFSIKNIPITSEGTQTITIKETKAPTGYSNQKASITLTVTTELKDGAYVVKSIDYTGEIERGPSGSTELKGFEATLAGNKISMTMKNYQLDLALRKFIINIAGQDVKEGAKYTREPVIAGSEVTKLASGTASWDNGTTAKKDHPKDALKVETGNRVVYVIRVYNEGEIPAYATKVTDYLPEGLKFVPTSESQINRDYGWTNPKGDGRTIETQYLKDYLLNAFDGNTINYKDLKIECEVVAKPGTERIDLKNIAEITEHSDEYGDTTVLDRDSQPGNVRTQDYGTQSQQDDDDFERLYLEPAKGKFELELEKVDGRTPSNKLQGAIFEVTVNGANKQTCTTDPQGKINITFPISEIGIQTITIKETQAPAGYSKSDDIITIIVTTDLQDGVYVAKTVSIDSHSLNNNYTDITTGKTKLKAKLENNKIFVTMSNYKLDLALRKFIISVAGTEVKEDGKYTREPSISDSEKAGLTSGTASLDNGTTAEKVHPKDPLPVETGNKVIYVIRVYNEGEIAGYAKKVTDYLPEGLRFIPQSESDINRQYEWTNPTQDGKTIETEYLKNELLNAFDGNTIDYRDLKIECEVIAKPGDSATILKNIAEITKHSDEHGDETVLDRDSEPGNVNTEGYGEESQQDDDDFERLILGQVGKYNLKLEKVNGYDVAEKLAGAEFEVTLPDGSTQTYTTDAQGVINIENILIEAVGEQTITIKETKAPAGYSKNMDTIVVKVVTSLEEGKYTAKVVSIKEVNDDDSQATNLTGDLKEVKAGKTELKANLVGGTIYVQMKNYKLDLALRKFIISVAGRELKEEDESYSREPVITDEELAKLASGSASLDDGTTALKTHSKEPIEVHTGNRVIYVIRVYNEGKIAGYAKKVTDYLPDGLKFVSDSSINSEYGWTNPSGDGKEIETTYLSTKLLDAFDGEHLDYEDLKIECEVVAQTGEERKDLRNIAEITAHSDENGDETVEDRDSVPDNVDRENYENKSQQDDDDFEDLYLEKAKEGKYNLELEKVDGYDITKKLEGAEFEITLPDGTTKKYTTPENGKIAISDLPITKLEEQTITIKETKAPEGYSRSTDTIVVKVQTEIENETYVAKIVKIGENTLTASSKEITIGDTDLIVNANDGTIAIKMKNYMLDLALRKFITKVNDRDITNRAPVFTKVSDTEFKYEHPKDPVEVANGNTVIYTLRIFNEGKIAGYANKIKDDLPSGLLFLPEHETNIEYRWKMYNKDGEETENVEEAEYIETDYLAKENEKEEGANLLKAFDQETMTMPDYRDVKIAFKVTEPNTSDRIIINTAEITDDRDKNNEPVDDIDSTPDNDDDDEDDIDEEKIKVKYFDLSLKKWVSESIVTYKGKTTVTKTGHTGDENPEPPAKVELKEKDLSKTTVKFKFIIKVTNEGDIAGYATEIEDYIPEGLKFLAEDNPKWREEDGRVVTDQLKDTLLQPGESAEVEIILTWVNGKNNLGEKVNWAEISKDYNDEGSPDIDSTPGNKEKDEDDIDEAPVILSIVTGISPTYVGLILAVVAIMASGVILIKKFVMEN